MDSNHFRGKVFGGFNRADVLRYIEEASRECAERSDLDQKTIAALENEKRTLCAQLEARSARISELEEAAAELERLRAEHVRLKARETSLEADCARMRARLDQIEPGYARYEALRGRVSEIEMAARARAAQIEQEAEQQIALRRRKLSQSLEEAGAAYEQARIHTENAAFRFRSELTQAGATMDKLSAFFAQVGHDLESVRTGAATADPEKRNPER